MFGKTYATKKGATSTEYVDIPALVDGLIQDLNKTLSGLLTGNIDAYFIQLKNFIWPLEQATSNSILATINMVEIIETKLREKINSFSHNNKLNKIPLSSTPDYFTQGVDIESATPMRIITEKYAFPSLLNKHPVGYGYRYLNTTTITSDPTNTRVSRNQVQRRCAQERNKYFKGNENQLDYMPSMDTLDHATLAIKQMFEKHQAFTTIWAHYTYLTPERAYFDNGTSPWKKAPNTPGSYISNKNVTTVTSTKPTLLAHLLHIRYDLHRGEAIQSAWAKWNIKNGLWTEVFTEDQYIEKTKLIQIFREKNCSIELSPEEKAFINTQDEMAESDPIEDPSNNMQFGELGGGQGFSGGDQGTSPIQPKEQKSKSQKDLFSAIDYKLNPIPLLRALLIDNEFGASGNNWLGKFNLIPGNYPESGTGHPILKQQIFKKIGKKPGSGDASPAVPLQQELIEYISALPNQLKSLIFTEGGLNEGGQIRYKWGKSKKQKFTDPSKFINYWLSYGNIVKIEVARFWTSPDAVGNSPEWERLRPNILDDPKNYPLLCRLVSYEDSVFTNKQIKQKLHMPIISKHFVIYWE